MIPDLKHGNIDVAVKTDRVLNSSRSSLVDLPRQYAAMRNSTTSPLFLALSPFLYPPIGDDTTAKLQQDKLLIRAVVMQKLTANKINYQQLRTSLLNNDNSVIKVRE